MKKLVISLVLTSAFFVEMYSQSAFYDAAVIRKQSIVDNGVLKISPKNKPQADTIISVLHHYFSEIDTSSSAQTIGNKIRVNPFFHNAQYSGITRGGGNVLNYVNMKSAASSIGGLDVTTIADGFAKFIVKRTKQELNIAFFDKFKEKISKEEYRDLRTVFPQTYRALSIIGDEIYNYEAYIQTLRESFENDLSNLTTNLPGIIDNHPDFFTKFPELEATLNSGCYIAAQLRDKIHPGDILADYPVDYLNKLNPNWKGAIQTLQLISASLRDSSKSDITYWVSSEQIKMLYSDTIMLKIYFGLLYQQAKYKYNSIHFQNITLIDILNDIAANWNIYPNCRNYFARFSEKTSKLNRMIKNYKKPANDSLAIEQYADYFNASIDLLEYTSEAGKLVPEKLLAEKYKFLIHIKDTLADYFDVTRSVSNLVLDINRRNYSSAIVNASHIYDIIINKYFISPEELEEAKNKISAAGGENAINEAVEHRALNSQLNSSYQPYVDKLYYSNKLKNVNYNKKNINLIFKYGSFMAVMVQAKSPDEVEAAIEAVALPTGSARIKRESSFNVALNAYCGLYAGHEEEKFSLKNGNLFNSYGVTAPIGISINWGAKRFLKVPCKKQGHFSHSIFMTVFDLGAIASFRFVDDTTKTLSKIELRDIISPGIFYSVGIPKSPLSINIGYQVTPLLRDVSSSSNTFQPSLSRFSIRLCVDIPLLNFYTKPK